MINTLSQKLPRLVYGAVQGADDGIWLVSFKQYDLEYFDLERKTFAAT